MTCPCPTPDVTGILNCAAAANCLILLNVVDLRLYVYIGFILLPHTFPLSATGHEISIMTHNYLLSCTAHWLQRASR